MAYPTIYDECLNDKHEDCQRRMRDAPDLPRGPDIVCGGGFCICECHWVDIPHERNQPWIDEVRETAVRAKELRELGG
jgi:hypothetical protein